MNEVADSFFLYTEWVIFNVLLIKFLPLNPQKSREF